MNLAEIDRRLESLRHEAASSAYSKQKNSLKAELQDFLFSLPDERDIFSATPQDVLRFLVFKDAKGKTKVHLHGCPDVGKKREATCRCPLRLSYNTVDSYIGKLRAIFKEAGRQGDWEGTLALGNPASACQVKEYLKSVTEEQLQAKVVPKQATPLFIDKLATISHVIESRLISTSLTPSEIFIAARDQAYFKTMFFSGDRAGDLGRVKTIELARFPADDGLLFNHVWGKTLRDGSANLFGIRRHPNPLVCPVRAIEVYMAIAQSIGLDLTRGFLFRPTNEKGCVVDKPFEYSAADARLKLYLNLARANEGETLHSFRSGCALTLAFSGASLADVMAHVGWKSSISAAYYMKLSDILRAGAPADLLASKPSGVEEASQVYKDYNHLKNFVLAFPPPEKNARKRPASSD